MITSTYPLQLPAMRDSAEPQRVVSGTKLQQFFQCALRPKDPRPSPDDCEKLARDIQIIVNRARNAELARDAERHGRSVDRSLLKDVSLCEEIEKRVAKIRAAAHQFLSATFELEDFGGHCWVDQEGALSLTDLQHFVGRIAYSPDGMSQPSALVRGRPRQTWHAAALKISRLIVMAMRSVGYCGRLKPTDNESVTSQVGAAIISWIYRLEIKPEGYAAAMRGRNRSKSKKLSFEELFPGAARIRVD